MTDLPRPHNDDKPLPQNPISSPETGEESAGSGGILGKFALAGLTLLMCAAIVAAAILGARWLIKTKPQSKRRAREESVALVETISLKPEACKVEIRATGTVIPARQVAIKPQVAGRVIKVSDKLIPGSSFVQGETLLQIEKVDYELGLASRKADLVQSLFDHKLELGHQDVARSEWEMLEDQDKASELDRELILRKPHLAAAEARMRSAEVAVERAQLDLGRTTVTAPFNLIVRDKSVDLGDQASAQTAVATVVGTDEYWVEISVPIGQLGWLRLPAAGEPGSQAQVAVRLATGEEQLWEGELIRRRPDLEPNGRMARLIVRVPDPLGQREGTPLLIGSFVHVLLQGPMLEGVFAIPRTAVHDGNTIRVRTPDGRLGIREIAVAFSSDENVLVREGLADGDELIVSDLPNAVPGMKIALPGENREADGKGRPGQQQETDE